jgi:hypothetical protein
MSFYNGVNDDIRFIVGYHFLYITLIVILVEIDYFLKIFRKIRFQRPKERIPEDQGG